MDSLRRRMQALEEKQEEQQRQHKILQLRLEAVIAFRAGGQTSPTMLRTWWSQQSNVDLIFMGITMALLAWVVAQVQWS